jgi:hypothetical protein
MLRKVSNLRLIILFGAIVFVYVALKVFRDTGRSKTLRTEIVNIDTSRVTRVVIEKTGIKFEVFRDDQKAWKVTLPENNKSVEATESSVKNALGGLLSIEPSRVATRDPAKWGEYEVDTSGTRILVYEGSKNTLDLVIGKFGIVGRQQFYTCVRLSDENTVYTADNFMGISYFNDPKSFRNSRFVSFTSSDSVSQISFRYPADTSFVLNLPDSVWYLGSMKADSASVARYISDIRYLSNTNFVDDVEPVALLQPVFTATIDFKGLKTIKINAYSNPKYGLILHSDFNPANYFSDEALATRIFKGKTYFSGGN